MKLQSSYLSALPLLLAALEGVNSIPMRFSIVKSSKECLYTNIAASEFITASLFILDGADLKARMTVQGPIASRKISSSAEVLAAALRYDKNGKDLALNIDTDIDFEELYDNLPNEAASWDDDYYYDEDDDDFTLGDTDDDVDDAMFEELYYLDDDDEYEFLEDDSMDDIEITEIRKEKAERDSMDAEKIREMKEARLEIKRKKFQAAQQKKEEAKRKMAEEKKHKANKHNAKKHLGLEQLRKGEPLQKTYPIEKEGWYRYCIAASSNTIEAEMELRTSTELGKPNTKTGHIQTYEHHDMIQREKNLLRKMKAPAVEEGVKEQDLTNTKNQISKLNRLLYEIKEKQKNERHRLSVHKAVNDHSHSRMVLNSLFETIFYITVSGFQVYTIRKWFSGSPILGY